MADRKVAFITGAARGLGKDIATVLGRDGFAVYLVDVLEDRLAQTAEELRAKGITVGTRKVDVANREEDFAAVEACVAEMGRLDVLVNCAGIVRMNAVTDVPQAEWDKIIAINLSGPFFLIQAALPHIIAAKGNIVNIASSNGWIGCSYTLPYSATKAALISMTKTLAVEYVEQPIRVNAVCPGPMATEISTDVVFSPKIQMEKIARYGGQRGNSESMEVAEVVAFIASDKASAVHGAIWTADTGVTAG